LFIYYEAFCVMYIKTSSLNININPWQNKF
jgi:hypothetical protein